MRVLITGGAGFIGSHLAALELRRAHEVTILDDLSTGSMDNIAALKSHPSFHYVIGTVLSEPLVGELVDQADVVFHLAAAVGVRLIIDEPVRTIETNVLGTDIVLRSAAKRSTPVLLTSTSEVYGKNAAVPFTEDSDFVLGPSSCRRWAYACSKAMDEFLALAYWRECQLPVTIVRLFNVIGPGQTGRYGMVAPTFAQQAVTGASITVYGDGTQTRSFTDVQDAVWAVSALGHRSSCGGQIVNVGNDEELSILALAQRIRALAGSASPIVLVPYAEAYGEGFEDMPRRVPALAKLRALIGYRPTTSLDDTLSALIEHQRLAPRPEK